MGLPEHRRIITHFDISEEGLRELEIWLRERLASGGTGWRFNTLNGIPTAKATDRGWGYLAFTECFDLDLVYNPLGVGGMWGAAIQDASGCGLLLGSTTEILFFSLDSVAIDAVGNVNISTFGGDVTLKIGAGKQLTGLDSSDAPMIQMTDGSPDLHLPTGGNIIFDL